MSKLHVLLGMLECFLSSVFNTKKDKHIQFCFDVEMLSLLTKKQDDVDSLGKKDIYDTLQQLKNLILSFLQFIFVDTHFPVFAHSVGARRLTHKGENVRESLVVKRSGNTTTLW